MYRLDLTKKSSDWGFFCVCKLSTHCKILRCTIKDHIGLHHKQQKVKIDVRYVSSAAPPSLKEKMGASLIVLVS